MDPFVEHLRYLGFTMTEVEDREAGPTWRAEHPVEPNLVLKRGSGGILLVAFFAGNEAVAADPEGFVRLANGLNRSALVVRFYADAEGDLALEAWYPDQYDREGFSTFLAFWRRDLALLSVEHLEEATRFLGDAGLEPARDWGGAIDA